MAEETQQAPAKKSALPMILGGLMVGLGLAAGGWFFMRRGPATTSAEAKVVEAKPQHFLHLENFVVNLADPEGHHFLRAGIDLGLAEEPGGGGHGDKVALPTGQIRDAILTVLTTWKSEDLITAEGKEKLKADLKKALQEEVPEMKVQEVYFSDFLVQR